MALFFEQPKRAVVHNSSWTKYVMCLSHLINMEQAHNSIWGIGKWKYMNPDYFKLLVLKVIQPINAHRCMTFFVNFSGESTDKKLFEGKYWAEHYKQLYFL